MNKRIAEPRKKSKFVEFFQKLYSSKYKYFIYIPALFLIIFILYLLFTISMPGTDPARIQEINAIEPLRKSLEQLYAYFRELDSQTYDTPVRIFTGVALIFGALFTFYFAKNYPHKKWLFIIFFILFSGFSLRFMYAIHTNAIVERQHDVLSIRRSGHYGIIMSYYRTGKGPEPFLNADGTVNFSYGYQMYHPRFAHISLAYFMRFMKIFLGGDEYVLYQSTRILLCFSSCLTLLFGYLILKEFFDDDRSVAFGSLILAFSPIFLRLSAMTNNDNFSTLFIFMAIYYFVKWYKTRKMPYIIGIAFGIGLGMASKLNVGLLAIPIGIGFIYVLVKEIIASSKEGKFQKSLGMLLVSFLVFAIICFPLGLYYPLKHLKEYGQPITYVYKVPNTVLAVKNTNVFQRFLSFSFRHYYEYPYVRLSGTSPLGQDYNIFEVSLKSLSYGEFRYSYTAPAYFINTLSLLAFIFVLFSIVFTIYLYIQNKEEKTNNSLFLYLAFMLIVVFGWSYITFNIKHPATCTMDFRYIIPLLISNALFTGLTFESLNKNNNTTIRIFSYVYLSVFGLYFLSTTIFYFIV